MERYLISGGTVLDATGAAPRGNTSVLVEDGLIAKLGDDAEIKAYALQTGGAVKTIDAAGKTVMPGLIDAHVHTSYGNSIGSEELNVLTSAEYRTLRGALDLRKVLRAGVTALCDPGGTYRVATALRDAVNAGMIEGPRMVAASQYLTTYNGIGSMFPTWIEHPVSAFSVMCNTRDEMITQVRKQIRDGVDIIKVSGDGDLHSSSGGPEGSLTPDDLAAIAEVTHLLGTRCTIHARGGRMARDAAAAGFDWVIHASYIDEDDLGVFVERGTPINPTLVLLVNIVKYGPDMGCSDGLVDAFKRELDAAHTNLSRAHRAGVMMLAGSDSGQSAVPYGEWHAQELECLMDYLGMSNMEAVIAGTRNAAFALDMEDRIGTLEEGKLADILVVDGDPLQDITVLQDKDRLVVIMKGGEVIDTETPLPEPTVYRWERQSRLWPDSRCVTQAFVRDHARDKPAWMVAKQDKADTAAKG